MVGLCELCFAADGLRAWAVETPGTPAQLRLCERCYGELRSCGSNALSLAEVIHACAFRDRCPKVPGYDLQCFHRPSRSVGADYYDVLELDADRLLILLAETPGSELRDHLALNEARRFFRRECRSCAGPSDLLVRADRVLFRERPKGRFMTAACVELAWKEGLLTAVSAGAGPMLLRRQGRKESEELEPLGVALGLDGGPLFERTLREVKTQLFPGDRVVLYSDAVVEAVGQDWLRHRIPELAGQPGFLEMLMKEVDARLDGASQPGNFSVVTLRRA